MWAGPSNQTQYSVISNKQNIAKMTSFFPPLGSEYEDLLLTIFFTYQAYILYSVTSEMRIQNDSLASNPAHPLAFSLASCDGHQLPCCELPCLEPTRGGKEGVLQPTASKELNPINSHTRDLGSESSLIKSPDGWNPGRDFDCSLCARLPALAPS